jgi:hypothetical protein
MTEQQTFFDLVEELRQVFDDDIVIIFGHDGLIRVCISSSFISHEILITAEHESELTEQLPQLIERWDKQLHGDK